MYFVKDFLSSHSLSFIVHLELEWLVPGHMEWEWWLPGNFPKVHCLLNTLTTNCLVLGSPSLIQIDSVNLNQVFILTSLWFPSLQGQLQGPLSGAIDFSHYL